MISIFLHKTFRTRLNFPNRSKWVQRIVCYHQNLEKHKYLSTISMLLHETFRTGSFYQDSRNESKQWYAMIKTYKNINISAQYQYFCRKPSEQGSFFWAGRNESKQWYAMIKTYKNINISAQYQYFCTWNLQNRAHFSELIFPSQSKWVQTVVCYDQNLQKHKYLSTISIFLHKTFRTRLNFPNRSKWVQTVVCYDQNLQKHKYLSTISIFLHETFRTGLFFWASRNESKQWYAMIKTYKNINISAQYQYFCTKPSEQGSFSKPVEMSPNSGMLWSKLTKT